MFQSRWRLSPVDGTAAKLSWCKATNFTCQLQLPKKKEQMYLFHSGSEGFFCSCVQRPDAVYVTQRENINNRQARKRAADSSKSSKNTVAIPRLKSVLFKLQIAVLLPPKTQKIEALVISNEKLDIFVVFPSLYFSYSGYQPSVCIHFTLTSACL